MDERCLIKVPIPFSVKSDLDRICAGVRRREGLHYGETAACLLVIGLREVRRAGGLPSWVHSVIGA